MSSSADLPAGVIAVHRGYQGHDVMYQVPELVRLNCTGCCLLTPDKQTNGCRHGMHFNCNAGKSIMVFDFDAYKVARVTQTLVGNSNDL